jgi:hypothetical protein
MKKNTMFLVGLVALGLGSTISCLAANAGEGRSLPVGEESPAIITSVYTAPEGEVQFLESRFKDPTAVVRVDSGKICHFKSIDGPAACENWFFSSGKTSVPVGCILTFESNLTTGDSSCSVRIESEKLKEASLFQAVSRLVRSPSVAL